MKLLEPLSALSSVLLHAAAVTLLITLWSAPEHGPEGASIHATIETVSMEETSLAEPDRQTVAELPNQTLTAAGPTEFPTQPPDDHGTRPPDDVAVESPPDKTEPPQSRAADIKPARPDRELAATPPDGAAPAAAEPAPVANTEEVPTVMPTAPPAVQVSAPARVTTPALQRASPASPPAPVRPVAPAQKQDRQPARSGRPAFAHLQAPEAQAGLTGAAPREAAAASTAYAAGLAGRLRSHTSFPAGAPSGTVVVHFSIDRSGRLLGRSLARSSGSSLLDAAALSTVDRAAPFPPFPPEMTRNRLDVTVPIGFHTN
jgi:periplasmic protein TonB